MIAIKNIISNSSIHRDLKNLLNTLLSDNDNCIYYVFYANAGLLSLPIITVIGEGQIVDTLIKEDWVVNSIETYKTFINVIEIDQLFVDKNAPHNIYYNLNCQLDQLVFYNDMAYDEGVEYFQINGTKNFLKETKKWFEAKCTNYDNILHRYIGKIDSENQNSTFQLNGLQQLLKEVIADFQVVFCPMQGFLKSYSESEVLEVILTYYKSGTVYLSNDDVLNFHIYRESPLPLEHFLYLLDFKSTGIGKKYDVSLLVESLCSLIKSLSVHLHIKYVKEFRERIGTLDIFTIKEEAKASVESWEDILEKQVKTELKTIYNPQAVFLLSKRYFNISLPDLKYEKGIQLFLVVLTHKTTYESVKHFSSTIGKQTNGRVKVTVILQKKSNWTRHIPMFYEFYKKYFVSNNLYLGIRFSIDYTKVEKLTLDNKEQYIRDCVKLLDKTYVSIKQNIEEHFCETQAMLYHYILQQSLILLIYNKLSFIPNIIELRYLWNMIQWFYPSVYKDLDEITITKQILFNTDSFVKSYPKQNDYISNCTVEDIKELDTFCGMIYTLTKEELKKSNSIIDVSVE